MKQTSDFFFGATIHNQQNLQDYDLFSSRNNNHLKFAFLLKPGIVELRFCSDEVKQNIHELLLADYDYDNWQPSNHTFQLINHRKANAFIENDRVNILVDFTFSGVSTVVIFRDELAHVCPDPVPGGMLDTYFNAFETQWFGVRYLNKVLAFRLWSPTAAKVELLLFHNDGIPVKGVEPILMKRQEKGIWYCEIHNDSDDPSFMQGFLYQYKIYAFGKITVGPDPYSFSMGLFSPFGNDPYGKSAIINMNDENTTPQGFHKKYSNFSALTCQSDLIAYEIHVRDFTIQPGAVDQKIAGTFAGFSEKIHYLKQLGITHVQLMPVMKCYTVNETDRNFSDQNTEKINYNWGYDPMHYFAPEGWLSTDATNPCVRIYELRALIRDLHDAGIGVILDVVYNHTYIVETFENVAPGCYYRLTNDYKISGHTGAGPTLESRRPMVRKLIVETLLHYIQYYHVDGFRFDLMCFFDHDTMQLIADTCRRAYDPNHPDSFILQGEAWLFSELSLDPEAKGTVAAVTKINYPESLTNLGIFNDTARDSFTDLAVYGVFAPDYANLVAKAASAIIGGLKHFNPGKVPFNNSIFAHAYHLFANTPSNCINFISVHDGLTLWDKINILMDNDSRQERLRAMKQASLMLFTSVGKILIHGGDEILRTKPVSNYDREKNRAITASHVLPEDDIVMFHENSYCSADFTNMIRWNKLKDSSSGAAEMMAYYKKLVQMRRSIPAFFLHPVESGLRFLTNQFAVGQYIPSLYVTFNDKAMKQFTMRFINGPKNETWFIAGDIHPKGTDGNPEHNPYQIEFNSDGVGELTFYRNQIDHFHIGKWGNPFLLQFKLVSVPGSWETLNYAYSPLGNNALDARMIDNNGTVLIDLSIPDHKVIPPLLEQDPFIAYLMNNKPTGIVMYREIPFIYDKILVVHNFSNQEIELYDDELKIIGHWQIIADCHSVGNQPAANLSEQFIDSTKGIVRVNARNSLVAARKKT